MAGKKEVLFGKELRKNELKTLAALIDFNRATGKVQHPELTLTEICKITKIKGSRTSASYQLELLASLIEKGVVDVKTDMVPKKHQKIGKIGKEKEEYERKRYCLNPKYQELFKDWIITSETKDDIEKLQSEGIFTFLNTTTFGIKKEWWHYPEIHYLHETVENTLNSLYNIKQLKAICILRDFSKQWNVFLQSDTPSIAKHWLWEIARSQLSPFFEKNGDELHFLDKKIDKELAILKIKHMEVPKDKKHIKEMLDKIKQQDALRLKKLKEKIKEAWYPDSIPWKQAWFGKNLPREMDRYNEEKARTELLIIKNILNDTQWQQFRELLHWLLVTFHEDVNKIGFYANIGSLSFPSGLYYDKDMKIDDKDPIDNHEYIFRALNNKATCNQLKEVIEDIDKKERQKMIFKEKTIEVKDIEKEMRDVIDIYSMRNTDRFNERFNTVFSDVIQKPIGNTSLKKWWNRIEDSAKRELKLKFDRMRILRDDIKRAVKKNPPEWLDLKKTDDENEIFTVVMEKYGSYVPKDVLETILREMESGE